eukprot:scaffold131887_cov21-Prasinocladus_malaysianus.AAC.1
MSPGNKGGRRQQLAASLAEPVPSGRPAGRISPYTTGDAVSGAPPLRYLWSGHKADAGEIPSRIYMLSIMCK